MLDRFGRRGTLAVAGALLARRWAAGDPPGR
jgi:hypothetical protein